MKARAPTTVAVVAWDSLISLTGLVHTHRQSNVRPRFHCHRFPTKDWTLIGQFDMTPDRSLQSFHTQVSEEFVKFLRVEMLEHHGKEHYCPLTTLR